MINHSFLDHLFIPFHRLLGGVTRFLTTLPIKSFVVGFYSFYKLDLVSADRTLDEYRSIMDLFTRRLKPSSRPIGEGIVSPVDGILRGVYLIADSTTTPIKGFNYKIADMLGSAELAKQFEGGILGNYYLSPRHYHHVHSPVEGRIKQVKQISGALWPVNNWGLNTIAGLFARNERVVFIFESEFGLVAAVMVGALNVGSIEIDDAIKMEPCNIARGQRLGGFNFGSAVVLLIKPNAGVDLNNFISRSSSEVEVKFGESINVSD